MKQLFLASNNPRDQPRLATWCCLLQFLAAFQDRRNRQSSVQPLNVSRELHPQPIRVVYLPEVTVKWRFPW